MKLLIGSHNPGKIEIFTRYLRDQFEIITLKDLKITDDPEETGKTFDDNALLKAKYFHEKAGLITLADDGGFEIDYLNGEPGVKTRRWLGYRMTDQELIDECLKRLKGVPREKRGAQLRAVIAICSDKECKTFTNAIRGIIPEQACPKLEAGLPFRSVLWTARFQKCYAELNETEKDQIEHRKLIMPEIINYLKNIC